MGYCTLSFLHFCLAPLLSWEFYIIFNFLMLLRVGEGVTAEGAAPRFSNESMALLQFKKSLSLGSQKSLSTWQDGSDCCTWKGVSCDSTTGFVTALDLYNFRLQASKLDSSLFELHRLRSLRFSLNSFGGMIPPSVSKLSDLTELLLSDCNFTGPIPKSVIQLSNLTKLDLSNNKLNGEIPSGLLNHPAIQYFNLAYNLLSGRLPDVEYRFSALREVNLSYNMLDDKIPSSINNLPHLGLLDLAGNIFSNTIQLSLFQNLKNLSCLVLSDNELSVELPKVENLNNQAAIFSSLEKLELRSCNITGEFPWFFQNARSLQVLDLSDNFISGQMPSWVWKLPHLQELQLSDNMLSGFEEAVNITGSVHLDLASSSKYKFPSKKPLKITSSITHLDISKNNIRGAIPPTVFCNMFNMQSLDLSRNNLTGVIPDCITNFTMLSILNLRENQLEGMIPTKLIYGPHTPIVVQLSGNQLTGKIASFLYNYSNHDLLVLDLSRNRLTGYFPCNWLLWLGQLEVLDLSNNQLQGPIPGDLNIRSSTWLRVLDLSDNELVGRVPKSLSNCSYLEVIKLGGNHLTGSFPSWLGDLDHLRVLMLHTNNLHGSIEPSSSKQHSFPQLKIFDISGNQLEGCLPPKLFQNFSSMKRAKIDKLEYHGYELKLPLGRQNSERTTSTIAAFMDLSHNRFDGNIPEEIGTLVGLYSLNLSWNTLVGPIPRSFGQLHSVELIDLSHNQLSGSIPEELENDTFLNVLDLSYNDLEGRIPQRNQFMTFDASSFVGNPTLCGLPLTISCPSKEPPVSPSSSSGSQGSKIGVEEKAPDAYIYWEYMIVEIGFAMGFLTIILPILFIEKVKSLYNKSVDKAMEALTFLPYN